MAPTFDDVMNKQPTPRILLAAIRANCLECSGGSRKQVRNCEIKYCTKRAGVIT